MSFTGLEIRQESILTKILLNKIVRIWMDFCQLYKFSYEVTWSESIDCYKISLQESPRGHLYSKVDIML